MGKKIDKQLNWVYNENAVATKPNVSANTLKPIYYTIFYSQLTYGNIIWVQNINTIRERRQVGFVTLNGNLAVSEWVGLVYDR